MGRRRGNRGAKKGSPGNNAPPPARRKKNSVRPTRDARSLFLSSPRLGGLQWLSGDAIVPLPLSPLPLGPTFPPASCIIGSFPVVGSAGPPHTRSPSFPPLPSKRDDAAGNRWSAVSGPLVGVWTLSLEVTGAAILLFPSPSFSFSFSLRRATPSGGIHSIVSMNGQGKLKMGFTSKPGVSSDTVTCHARHRPQCTVHRHRSPPTRHGYISQGTRPDGSFPPPPHHNLNGAKISPRKTPRAASTTVHHTEPEPKITRRLPFPGLQRYQRASWVERVSCSRLTGELLPAHLSNPQEGVGVDESPASRVPTGSWRAHRVSSPPLFWAPIFLADRWAPRRLAPRLSGQHATWPGGWCELIPPRVLCCKAS